MYVMAVYCHSVYLTYMWRTSWEMLDWMKHKLELRLPGEISITSDMTPPLWRFWTVVLEKTLESPLVCKEIQPVNVKGNQPWILIGRTDAELKLQYFGHLMQRTNSLGMTLMLGKVEGKNRRGTIEDEVVRYSITNSQSLFKLMFTESEMPYNHAIL